MDARLILSDMAAGVTMTGLYHLVPDAMMTDLTKIILSVVTAFAGGFAYHAGRALWGRVSKKKVP